MASEPHELAKELFGDLVTEKLRLMDRYARLSMVEIDSHLTRLRVSRELSLPQYNSLFWRRTGCQLHAWS